MLHHKSAFTLIETLIVIAVFTLAFGAVSGFILYNYRTQSYTLQRSMAIDEARKGIETMVREVREARPGDDGSYPIELAQDFEFIFYSDIDKDASIERVRYFFDGSDFKKGVIKPQGSPIQYSPENEVIIALSRNVGNTLPIFRYFDGSGQEILDLPAKLKDVKLLRVYLAVQNFELESNAQIRNLKTNL